jgi:SPP1 gp7 family putative phage head morphogenesis protein
MAVVEFNIEEIPQSVARAIARDTLVQGAKPRTWWRRQKVSLIDTVLDTARTSLQNGESAAQAAARLSGGVLNGERIKGALQATRAQANALAATAFSAVTNEARIRSFQQAPDVIKSIQQLSTFDNRTSDICIAYSGLVWDAQTLKPIGHDLPFNGGPPRHFNCRSTLIPVTRSFRELGFDIDELPPGTRATMDGQVPADLTFSDWLKTKPPEFVDDLLGPKRAKLWRDNKIALRDLVNRRGDPVSLATLEQKATQKVRPKPKPKPQPKPKPPPPTVPPLHEFEADGLALYRMPTKHIRGDIPDTDDLTKLQVHDGDEFELVLKAAELESSGMESLTVALSDLHSIKSFIAKDSLALVKATDDVLVWDIPGIGRVIGPGEKNLAIVARAIREGRSNINAKLVKFRGDPVKLSKQIKPDEIDFDAPWYEVHREAHTALKGSSNPTTWHTRSFEKAYPDDPRLHAALLRTKPLRLVEVERGGAHYKPFGKFIVMQRNQLAKNAAGKSTINLDGRTVWRHEFGHHMDYEARGVGSMHGGFGAEFIDNRKMTALFKKVRKRAKGVIPADSPVTDAHVRRAAKDLDMTDDDFDALVRSFTIIDDVDNIGTVAYRWDGWSSAERIAFRGHLARAVVNRDLDELARFFNSGYANGEISGSGGGGWSDTISALGANRIRMTWGHSDAYWKTPGARMDEVMANYVEIRADRYNNRASNLALYRWFFPEFDEVGDKMLQKLGGI